MIVNHLYITETECPLCNNRKLFTLQFRYGDVWGHRYRTGETLQFSGEETDVGTPKQKRVVLRGLENWCDSCKLEEGTFEAYIFLENDRIVGFAPADGTYDFGDNEDDFLVLKE